MPDPADFSEQEGGGTLARRAGIVAAGTLTSRALGFARDIVLAAIFPIATTDMFFIAFTMPNALRVLLGEGAVSAAVVPVFAEERKKRGEEAARAYFARMTGLMIVVLGVVSVLGVALAPLLVMAYAPGYLETPERFDQTVALTRAVFPYIFFIGLAALAMGGLNALRRFVAPAFAPVMLNISLIACAFLLVGPFGGWGVPAVMALAAGALLGGALQVVVQWPAQRRAGLLRLPRIALEDPAVKKTLRLMLPLLAAFGVYQVNTALGRALATYLPEGSPSYIYYGQRVVEIPQGMFALAIATAALPTLSDLRASGDEKRVREVFGSALRMTLFLAIPSTFAIAALAEPIAAVAFGRGEFGRSEVLETAASLRWQAVGVWAIASVRTVVPMFFAYNDTKSPVVASAANLFVFAALGISLMQLFEHVGIAMALSGAGVVQLVMLLWLLRRRVGRLGLTAVAKSALRVGLAALLMGGLCHQLSLNVDWSAGGNDVMNILALFGIVFAGALSFTALAWILRVPELRQLAAAVRRRLLRST